MSRGTLAPAQTMEGIPICIDEKDGIASLKSKRYHALDLPKENEIRVCYSNSDTCGDGRFLAVFLRNLLLNEKHPLHNRTLHISGALKEIERADIENDFRPKTASHILKLREAFPNQVIFEWSDVLKVIDMKSSRASDLLKKMAGHEIIEPVSGHGKGEYRFWQQES